jgi:hypothetical protein
MPDTDPIARDAGTRPRGREPWPWIVGGLLATMIGVSVAFLATALRHPDPPVVNDAYRAGLEYAADFESPVALPGTPGPAPAAGSQAPASPTDAPEATP